VRRLSRSSGRRGLVTSLVTGLTGGRVNYLSPTPSVDRRGGMSAAPNFLPWRQRSIESVLNLYVSVCAWGTGTKAQRVARVVQPILEDGALDALQRSFEAARPPGAALACHGRCLTVCRSGQCSSGRTFPDLVSEHVPVDSDVLRNRRLELMSVLGAARNPQTERQTAKPQL